MRRSSSLRWLLCNLIGVALVAGALAPQLAGAVPSVIGTGQASAAPPVTGNPFAQRQVFPDPTAMSHDNFGQKVALSGDGSTLAVVSIPVIYGVGRDAGSSLGPGTVYVFGRNGDGFSTPQSLADPSTTGDYTMRNYAFGTDVALSGDGGILVVGVPGTLSTAGRVYVYRRTGGSFAVSQVLADPAAMMLDGFTGSVALSADGRTLAVRAPDSVYVYGLTGDSFGAPQTLTDPAVMDIESTGHLALSGDGSILAVGSYSARRDAGTVSVYRRTGSEYGTPQTLANPRATKSNGFGAAIALSQDGSTLAAEANFTLIDGSTVYVYTFDGSSFAGTPQTLTDPAGRDDGFSGADVALSGDGGILVVGGDGANGDAGVLHVYSRNGNRYTVRQTITDPAGASGDLFGAVALTQDGSTLAVGAFGTNSYRGAAYLFTAIPAIPATGAAPLPASPGASTTSPLPLPLYPRRLGDG